MGAARLALTVETTGERAASNTVVTAGSVRLYNGLNYATVDLNTRWVEVCDMEEDGNGVFAIFGYVGGEWIVGDGNGSKGGCGNDYLPNDFVQMHVCEDGLFGPSCVGPATSP